MAKEPVVIIPPAHLRHILSKPEGEIDAYGPQNETIQAPYTIRDEDIWINNYHFDIVRKQLTKNLPFLADEIAEELAFAFEHYWGSDGDWKNVPAWDSLLQIISRASNRVFIGVPLCRDERFLEHSRAYSMSIFGGGALINVFPSFLKPIVGSLVFLAGRRHLAACQRLCLSIVKQRIEENHLKKTQPDTDWEPPKDVLQWVIDMCYETEDPTQLEPSRVAHRLLMMNMVAIHSTSFTTTNTILDLYSSDPSSGFVEGLREECERVILEDNCTCANDVASQLHRIDSTIRESMRFSTFGIVGLPRRVSAPNGLNLGDVHIPCGVRLGVPIHEIHRDTASYSSPSDFDAFRFSRPFKDLSKLHSAETNLQNAKSDSQIPSTRQKQQHQVQVSLTTGCDEFLGFGHGKHTCPGRFFAALEMKLVLAYVVTHYDVEYLPQRPAQSCIMETKLPSKNVNIKIRRRREGNWISHTGSDV